VDGVELVVGGVDVVVVTVELTVEVVEDTVLPRSPSASEGNKRARRPSASSGSTVRHALLPLPGCCLALANILLPVAASATTVGVSGDDLRKRPNATNLCKKSANCGL
jgi:hypothetical protein